MSRPGAIYPFHQILSYNPPVQEVSCVTAPTVHESCVMGAQSIVVGDVHLCEDVFVGFHSVIRADSSYPFYIGEKSNIQDFVVVHCHPGQYLYVDKQKMGVYLEGRVSVLHHSAIHGPLFIGSNTFVGQHVSIYGAIVGRNCVIMHGAVIANQVKIPNDRFVSPNQTVVTQEEADKLPSVPEQYGHLNHEIADFYVRLGRSYRSNTPLVISGHPPFSPVT